MRVYVQPFPATGAKYLGCERHPSGMVVVAKRTRARIPATGPMGSPDHHDSAELCVQRTGAGATGRSDDHVLSPDPPEEL